jgi:hypothetical protein
MGYLLPSSSVTLVFQFIGSPQKHENETTRDEVTFYHFMMFLSFQDGKIVDKSAVRRIL